MMEIEQAEQVMQTIVDEYQFVEPVEEAWDAVKAEMDRLYALVRQAKREGFLRENAA